MNGVLFALLLAAGLVHAGPWSLADGAQSHPPFHGVVPAQSEVIFSSRFKREEAPRLAAEFGATRAEWGYATDASFVTSLTAVAPWYGGALNANGPLPSDEGWAKDFDGQTIVVPRMRAWGGQMVTTTHPQTQQAHAEQVQKFVAVGARSIQVDDPLMQLFSALYLGGDFNPATLAGFRSYLAQYPDQALLRELGLNKLQGTYRDYLVERHEVKGADDYARRYRSFPSTRIWLAYIKSTVREHYSRLRRQLEAVKPRPLALSMNLSVLYEPTESNPYFFLAPFADYSMPETHIEPLAQMVSQAATARALGLGFVPSIRPLGTAANRVAIATLYALGGQVIVPWDVYVGNDDKGMARRYFGRAADFGDLYGFVREHAELFDGHETAAEVGILAPVDKLPLEATRLLVHELVERQIPFAFVPLGGSQPGYRADSGRLARFRVLLSMNQDGDYSAADLVAFAESKVPRLMANRLATEVLDDWRPFVVAPGQAQVRLIPRAKPGHSDALVVHVIDASRGDPQPADKGCHRRIGIRAAVLGSARVKSANWVHGKRTSMVKPEVSGDGVFFSLPDCPLWGLLTIQTQR